MIVVKPRIMYYTYDCFPQLPVDQVSCVSCADTLPCGMELRRKNVFLAKAAELLDRFDDMVEHMKAVVKGGPQLTQEERNLFSVAFKRSVGDRRGAVAAVQKAAKAANAEEADSVAVFAQEYIQQLNDELEAFIATALYLLDSALIPCASDPESLVFYLKMKADYHRYMAELGFDDSYARERARQTYGEAERLATKLPVTHPIRLAVALNYAVFLLDIMTLGIHSFGFGMVLRLCIGCCTAECYWRICKWKQPRVEAATTIERASHTPRDVTVVMTKPRMQESSAVMFSSETSIGCPCQLPQN